MVAPMGRMWACRPLLVVRMMGVTWAADDAALPPEGPGAGAGPERAPCNIKKAKISLRIRATRQQHPRVAEQVAPELWLRAWSAQPAP